MPATNASGSASHRVDAVGAMAIVGCSPLRRQRCSQCSILSAPPCRPVGAEQKRYALILPASVQLPPPALWSFCLPCRLSAKSTICSMVTSTFLPIRNVCTYRSIRLWSGLINCLAVRLAICLFYGVLGSSPSATAFVTRSSIRFLRPLPMQ
jgi:hypothetical protein